MAERSALQHRAMVGTAMLPHAHDARATLPPVTHFPLSSIGRFSREDETIFGEPARKPLIRILALRLVQGFQLLPFDLLLRPGRVATTERSQDKREAPDGCAGLFTFAF
jgi:hypothetical protein